MKGCAYVLALLLVAAAVPALYVLALLAELVGL